MLLFTFASSYRVAAVDHGLFSFTDVRYGTWPVILVTNPKHALFTMAHHEPLHLLKDASHIRFVINDQYAIVIPDNVIVMTRIQANSLNSSCL